MSSRPNRQASQAQFSFDGEGGIGCGGEALQLSTLSLRVWTPGQRGGAGFPGPADDQRKVLEALQHRVVDANRQEGVARRGQHLSPQEVHLGPLFRRNALGHAVQEGEPRGDLAHLLEKAGTLHADLHRVRRVASEVTGQLRQFLQGAGTVPHSRS